MKRNHIAKDLRTPKYKMRVVCAKKGRGSWKRKEKYQIQAVSE
jgi:stalled ribosome alternative rescue factor ArfA